MTRQLARDKQGAHFGPHSARRVLMRMTNGNVDPAMLRRIVRGVNQKLPAWGNRTSRSGLVAHAAAGGSATARASLTSGCAIGSGELAADGRG